MPILVQPVSGANPTIIASAEPTLQTLFSEYLLGLTQDLSMTSKHLSQKRILSSFKKVQSLARTFN